MHPFITLYNQNALPKLKEFKQYTSQYLIPRVTKVSINVGIGDQMTNGKAVEEIANSLKALTGQKAVEAKARIAIAGFKIRQGNVVGLRVTLRGERMNDFLMKLTQIALPRTRDFRGLKPTSITADGNLNVGIRDSIIFPEANPDATSAHGLQVCIVSNAKTLEESRLLYESLGFVFQADGEVAPRKKKGRNYSKNKK